MKNLLEHTENLYAVLSLYKHIYMNQRKILLCNRDPVSVTTLELKE